MNTLPVVVIEPGPNALIAVADVEENDLRAKWAACATTWLKNWTSEKTRTTYKYEFSYFLKWLDKDPWLATRDDIINYRDKLTAEEHAASTVSAYVSCVSSFYQAAVEAKLTEVNPAHNVKTPTVEPYAGAKWLTAEQAKKLLAQIDTSADEGKRDKAIVLSMLTMALRVSEVTHMTQRQLQETTAGGRLTYTPKGGATVARPIPSKAWQALREWLAVRPNVENNDHVFVALDRQAKWRKPGPMTAKAIADIISRYSLATLGERLNCHALRHTALTEVWMQSKDLLEVQAMALHASIETSRHYVHVVEDSRGERGDSLAAAFGA